MTEPQNLQHRVAIAFKEPASLPVEEAMDQMYLRVDHPGADLLHSLEPDIDDLIDEQEDNRHSMLRYWLAGGGLVASALVLSFDTTSGFFLLALCLGAIGVAAVIYSFAERLEKRVEKPAERMEQASASRAGADLTMLNQATSEALVGTVHDALGDITVCRNLDGVILSANNTFRRIVRSEAPEGRTCESLGIRFKPTKVEHCYDVEFASPEGQRIYVWHDIVTRDPLINDFVIQSIARDVTNERMDAAAREQARSRAEQESIEKSRLIATVSHEIRTPLSGLLGMGQLLSGTTLTPEQRNYLDGIAQSGTALVQLVEDLLDFSMLSSGRFKLNPRRETVRLLLEAAVEMLSSRAHAKGTEIAVTISPDLPEALVFDAARLRQVLYNVIGNAVKFTEKGGVLVSAALDGSALLIRVRDSGPGMNDAEMKRVFGEFEQGELSGAREGGVGLGLAISARIMAETGGALTVESRSGQGSTFQIRLPVGIDSIAMRRSDELTASRVLLLAPAGPAAAAISTTLKALGAEARTAASAAEVSALLTEHGPFTDIIVDHRLDAEFTGVLRQEQNLVNARRIFMVNPESRPAQISGTDYHSWLIRPLREQSLIDVLTGKLQGLEPRSSTGGEFPVLAAEQGDDPTQAAEDAETGLSILVGEDDPVNAMISQAILEKAGHRVLLVNNFVNLEQALEEFPADLILADYRMPDGTCDAFLSRLRASEYKTGSRALPVIVLTADATDQTRRKLLRDGADLVLVKPASPEMLHNAITRLGERLIHAA